MEPRLCLKSTSHHRVDSDYSKRRLAQKYFGVVDPDYYEWESHILFDDSHKDTVFKKRANCERYQFVFLRTRTRANRKW